MINVKTVPNNAGLVPPTAGNDLLHTLNQRRKARITKILAWNNTGANVTLRLGTLTNAGVFAQILPTLQAINGVDNVWQEEEIPGAYWQFNASAGALGVTGDIYMIASAASVAGTLLVSLELEEDGA